MASADGRDWTYEDQEADEVRRGGAGMSGNTDTIRTALQGAMVGAWGRENALRSLADLEAENEQLRAALEQIEDIHPDEYVTVAQQIAREALAAVRG